MKAGGILFLSVGAFALGFFIGNSINSKSNTGLKFVGFSKKPNGIPAINIEVDGAKYDAILDGSSLVGSGMTDTGKSWIITKISKRDFVITVVDKNKKETTMVITAPENMKFEPTS